MARRVALHYFPGDSAVHAWDGRCKILGLGMVTATLLREEWTWLLGNTVLLVGLFILSRLPAKRFLRELRGWALFLGLVFLLHGVFTEGAEGPIFPGAPIAREGLRQGGVACWRLGLMVGYGILMTAVTRPREIRDAVIWFLKPVPFLPERPIGLMVSLTLRFFSVIFDEAEEIRLAHRARLGDRGRNPVRKARALILPLLRRSFARVEDVTLALMARGYRDDIPVPLPSPPLSHFIPLMVFLVLMVVL